MHSLFEKLCQKFKSLKINYIYFLDHDLFHFGKKYSILGRVGCQPVDSDTFVGREKKN